MQRRFIVLIDFSPVSGDLLRYSLDWSRQARAALLLVHRPVFVAPAFADRETRESLSLQAREEALHKLKDLVRSVLPDLPARLKYLISEDPLQQTLERLCAKEPESLIFTGLKGGGPLRKLFIGSVTAELADHTVNTLVAMPGGISRFTHEKLYVAVSEKYPFNLPALNRLLMCFDKSPTRLTFFHLARPYADTLEMERKLQDLCSLFGDRYPADYAIYEGEHAFADIRKVINDRTDELLVLQKGSRMLSDKLFRRFLINELVHDGQTPMVILP